MLSVQQLINQTEDGLVAVRINIPEGNKGIWFIDDFGWFVSVRIDGQIDLFEDSKGAERFLSELV